MNGSGKVNVISFREMYYALRRLGKDVVGATTFTAATALAASVVRARPV